MRDRPDENQIERWLLGTDDCEAIDGCGGIEPDGYCPHGEPSWLIVLNLI